MDNLFYYTKYKRVFPCESLDNLKNRFENKTLSMVRQNQVSKKVWISTVFIPINMRYFGEGPPIVYETMIFGGKHDQLQIRYSTYKEVLNSHRKLVKKLKKEIYGI